MWRLGRLGILGLALMVLGALSACGKAMLPISTPESEFVRKGKIKNVVRANTRSKTLISGWDTTLQTSILYESWEYRAALLDFRTKSYKWNDEERAAARDAEIKAFDANISFIAGVYGSQRDWMKLDAKEPAWQPYLTAPGGDRIRPTTITPIELPPRDIPVVFPSLSSYTSYYRLTFARSAANPPLPMDPADIRLTFTGTLGLTDLEWHFGRETR